MLQKISSLLLILNSLVAKYQVDVSIKYRIQYWLCPCSFISGHIVSLNLFPRVYHTADQRGGFLNLRQTQRESQIFWIRFTNTLPLKALLPLTKDINFSFDANRLCNFSAFINLWLNNKGKSFFFTISSSIYALTPFIPLIVTRTLTELMAFISTLLPK